ncbi:MAG: molecular chaperone DnaJ [Candidatus Wildermuthbacteria bacterium]|nr:molecular chaperone DnaJ [Candidatus Wildermuthbacteria bacterium]
MKDYYKILGIAKNASQEDIKKAYYKLAHQHHPDKGGDEARFKEVNEAYQTLSNKEKRAQYDRFGRVFEGGVPGGGEPGFAGFRWAWGAPGAGEEDFGFDFPDVGEIFEDFFGGAGETQKEARRGNDIEIEIELPLEATLERSQEELVLSKLLTCTRCQGTGGEPGSRVKECFSCRGSGHVQKIQRTIFGTFTKQSLCPECSGEGWKAEKTCNVCKGEGRIKDQEELKVWIPAGVDTNQILKIEGKGDVGRKKGKAGDLYIRINVKPHPVFERRGDDVYMSRSVSFPQAALGDDIQVPTLGGQNITLTIPAGTESGKVFRVPEKGIPHYGRLGRGNMYVELKVQTPKKLTKEQKDLLEKLKEKGL